MDPNTVSISLLGGFDCALAGNRISLPLGAQRLLALLALQEDGAHRAGAAGRLWPDSSIRRAAGNLRSALWQSRQLANITVIESFGPRLRISAAVLVDLHAVQHQTQQILECASCVSAADCDAVVAALGRELLPDWTEDWLVLERERWDQVRLYGLEGVAEKLRASEQYLGAMKAALAAVAVEPIRETAHRIVIEIHLAQGNIASALVHYQRYRTLIQRELGVAPSLRMTQLANALLLP